MCRVKPGFGKAGTCAFITMMSGAPTLAEQHQGARLMDVICFHPSAQLNLPRDTEFQDVPRDRLPETARFSACHFRIIFEVGSARSPPDEVCITRAQVVSVAWWYMISAIWQACQRRMNDCAYVVKEIQGAQRGVPGQTLGFLP